MDPALVELFKKADKDNSGTLTADELYNSYRYSQVSKISDANAVRLLMLAVTDKDVITFEQL